mmetsp:Transcript_1746/g.3098  ORF Transcript_1746/g.3098 Transcript_1746/m.3098 type:complete len:110 (-) Transcript_1746:500-829(-)
MKRSDKIFTSRAPELELPRAPTPPYPEKMRAPRVTAHRVTALAETSRKGRHTNTQPEWNEWLAIAGMTCVPLPQTTADTISLATRVAELPRRRTPQPKSAARRVKMSIV